MVVTTTSLLAWHDRAYVERASRPPVVLFTSRTRHGFIVDRGYSIRLPHPPSKSVAVGSAVLDVSTRLMRPFVSTTGNGEIW